MDQQTVRQLSALNRNFYQQVAGAFNDSRHEAWEGWQFLLDKKLILTHPEQVLSVLDLGCGNGRFGVFLSQVLKHEKIQYLGIDVNQELLNFAQTELNQTHLHHTLLPIDLIGELDSVPDLLHRQTFDLIAVFGFLHHVPSHILRRSLFSHINSLLSDSGKAIITTWNFRDNQKLMARAVPPSSVGLTVDQLETNDFILDWQREQTAFRYCHYTSPEEIQLLGDHSGLELTHSFKADGSDHQSNTYYVFEKVKKS